MHRSVDVVDLEVAWPEVATASIPPEPPLNPAFHYIDDAIGRNPEQAKVSEIERESERARERERERE
jgi:hypothetical protein